VTQSAIRNPRAGLAAAYRSGYLDALDLVNISVDAAASVYRRLHRETAEGMAASLRCRIDHFRTHLPPQSEEPRP